VNLFVEKKKRNPEKTNIILREYNEEGVLTKLK